MASVFLFGGLLLSVATVAHHGLLDQLASDPSGWERENRVAVLANVERLRRWLDAREAAVLTVAQLRCDDVNSGARDLTQLIQQQSGVSYGTAKRRAARGEWLPKLPAASASLLAGEVGSDQIDLLCALAERLPPEVRLALYLSEPELVNELKSLTPAQARRRLLEFETEMLPDDGKGKLDKQQAANSLRFRKASNGATGLGGQLDPISAAYLRTALDHKVTELWRLEAANRSLAEPPSDIMSSERRRAEALVALVRQGHAAGAGSRGHAELLVLIDYKTLLGDLAAAGICRLGDGTPIPGDVARRLACDASIIPVVLGSPSQPLDVGREARVATTAQKAAARAVHQTCSVKGCDVAFQYCDMHHVKWWRNGGQTDFDNLVPLCSKHHHLVHDHGWELRLDDEHSVTLHRDSPRTRHPVTRAAPAQPVQPRPQAVPTPMRC